MGIGLWSVLVKIVKSYKISLKIFFLLLFSPINLLGSCCPCCDDDSNINRIIYIVTGTKQKDDQDSELINNGLENISEQKDDQDSELINSGFENISEQKDDQDSELINSGLENISDEEGKMLPMLHDKITFKEGSRKSIKTKKPKQKEGTGHIKKNIDKTGGWDEYGKFMKDYELGLSNKNILDNPFTELLPLYCILEPKYKRFYCEHEKVSKDYQKYLCKELLKNTSNSGFYDYVSNYEYKMSENINQLTYNEKLVKKIDGASINTFHGDKKNDRNVAFVNIGTYEYLQKAAEDICIPEGVIMISIQNCFYKILSNKLKSIPIANIKETFDQCFVCEKKAYNGLNIALSNDQIGLILNAYYDICKFHNLTFLVLHYTNDQNSIYKGNADIKKHYKNVGAVLNTIHSNIVGLLNSRPVK